jgi:hypothetical protein
MLFVFILMFDVYNGERGVKVSANCTAASLDWEQVDRKDLNVINHTKIACFPRRVERSRLEWIPIKVRSNGIHRDNPGAISNEPFSISDSFRFRHTSRIIGHGLTS